MKDIIINAIFYCLFAAIGFIVGCVVMDNYMEKTAVQHNFAHWSLSDGGDVTFEWNTNAPTKTKE